MQRACERLLHQPNARLEDRGSSAGHGRPPRRMCSSRPRPLCSSSPPRPLGRASIQNRLLRTAPLTINGAFLLRRRTPLCRRDAGRPALRLAPARGRPPDLPAATSRTAFQLIVAAALQWTTTERVKGGPNSARTPRYHLMRPRLLGRPAPVHVCDKGPMKGWSSVSLSWHG
jgi:hypothetical protein